MSTTYSKASKPCINRNESYFSSFETKVIVSHESLAMRDRNQKLVGINVIGLHAVQFGNNWMRKILRSAKVGRGLGRIQWTVRGIF